MGTQKLAQVIKFEATITELTLRLSVVVQWAESSLDHSEAYKCPPVLIQAEHCTVSLGPLDLVQ